MSETIEQTTTALAVLNDRALVPAEVFKPGGVRLILDQIKAEVAGEKIDVSTEEGRAHCRSLAFKIARSKTALDAMGKTLSDEWRKRAEAIHVERRLIEKELDDLRDRVRAPLTAYEEREKNRVAAHKDALNTLERLAGFDDEITVEAIDQRLVQASTFVTTRTWDEFQDRASDLFAKVNDALNDLRATVVREEKEKAETARLQAEREEQAWLQAVREQEAREARIAEEAALRARQEAEERAQREAEEREKIAQEAARQTLRRAEEAARAETAAKMQAEYEEKRAEWEANAKKQTAEAAEAAATAERQLIAEQAEAERKAAAAREADKKHHAAVNREARDAIEKIIDRHFTANTPVIPGSCATAIVTALAKREIPHCKIEY